MDVNDVEDEVAVDVVDDEDEVEVEEVEVEEDEDEVTVEVAAAAFPLSPETVVAVLGIAVHLFPPIEVIEAPAGRVDIMNESVTSRDIHMSKGNKERRTDKALPPSKALDGHENRVVFMRNG